MHDIISLSMLWDKSKAVCDSGQSTDFSGDGFKNALSLTASYLNNSLGTDADIAAAEYSSVLFFREYYVRRTHILVTM